MSADFTPRVRPTVISKFLEITASPHFVHGANDDRNIEGFFEITGMGRDGGLAVRAGSRDRVSVPVTVSKL